MRKLLPLLWWAAPLLLTAQEPEERLQELQVRLADLDAQREALLAPIEAAKLEVLRRDLKATGLPALEAGETLTEHPGHLLVYSPEHRQPKWTAHLVTPDVVTGNLARVDTFLNDPLVPSNDNYFDDYWFSGYDRGHLVPSADLRWSLEAMTATYYYTNISPQKPELNRGAWAELEDWVRRTVRYGGGRVFVVTGPVLEDGLPVLETPKATHGVRVPKRFFKVLADLDGAEPKGIAFLMENGLNDHPVISYAVPIDSVERLTGIDFFPAVDDAMEDRIEAMRDPQAWYHEGDPFFGEVEPIPPPLPRGLFNTVQARHHIGNVATICGTVVSTRRTAKANALYLNMDRMHPHQDFYVTVWDHNGPNFSYDPETYLQDRKICVTGKVTVYDGIPRISVNNEGQIVSWEEAVR